jgi:predicted O-methyltransferase YrrM
MLRFQRHVEVFARARAEARRLRQQGIPDALLLAEVVRRGTRWRLTADERRWVSRIEAERRRMERSLETVRWSGGVQMPVAEITSRASQPWRGGRLLYAALRAFCPTRGLEMGTCLGISAAYQAAALAENGAGRLVTLEGYDELAAQAVRLWSNLALGNVEVVVGQFAQTLEPVLAAEPVDYAYIDGDHREEPTVAYFNLIRTQCRTRTLLVFDDIRWSDGMRAAWNRISSHDDICSYADLGRLGFVIVCPRT